MARAAHAVPHGFHTVTPQLTLDNAAHSIDWYKKAFGAEEVARSVGPDGKILHAEITIGNSHVMMNDAMGGKTAKDLGGAPSSFWIYVEDSDALFHRAVGAGGTVVMPMADQFWGDRAGALKDPAGFTWWIATRKEDLTHDEIRRRMDEFMKQQAAQHAHH